MQVESVQMLYLHLPDPECSLESSLQGVHELQKEGLVQDYGLSNYSKTETQRAIEICKERGFALPTAYQGLYNPVNRRVEEELLPLLRENSIRFIAFNPLAAGMLTGKHKRNAPVAEGRFKDNSNYLGRFYEKRHIFDALEIIQEACDDQDISMVEATYRWLLLHSSLKETDGLLLGASSLNQLDTNLRACAHLQPLPSKVLESFDAAWNLCSEDAGAFWRGYHSDQPERHTLDQGLEYSTTNLNVRSEN